MKSPRSRRESPHHRLRHRTHVTAPLAHAHPGRRVRRTHTVNHTNHQPQGVRRLCSTLHVLVQTCKNKIPRLPRRSHPHPAHSKYGSLRAKATGTCTRCSSHLRAREEQRYSRRRHLLQEGISRHVSGVGRWQTCYTREGGRQLSSTALMPGACSCIVESSMTWARRRPSCNNCNLSVTYQRTSSSLKR